MPSCQNDERWPKGRSARTRRALDEWMRQLPDPWIAGMEATLFTGWIYDHLVLGGAIAFGNIEEQQAAIVD
jgi:hypothetical protein